MGEISKEMAKKNIEEIVNSMNVKRMNYVFLNNKFITQELLVYDANNIITFFVRIKKNDYKLKKYCHKQCKYLVGGGLLYYLIVSRITMHKYNIANFDSIEFFGESHKLLFADDSGNHKFKISKTNIYGFDQTEQIEKLKDFVNKIGGIVN